MSTHTKLARWPLSNFGEIPGGMPGFERADTNRYPTLEHAYQAAKTLDPSWWAKIAAATSPGAAKRLGRQVPLRNGWDRMKYGVMETLLALKWNQEPFRSQLLATGDEWLVEETAWHDTYWGICVCDRHDSSGANQLGYLLMALRQQLQGE